MLHLDGCIPPLGSTEVLLHFGAEEHSEEIPGAKWAVPQTPPVPTNLSRHSSRWR